MKKGLCSALVCLGLILGISGSSIYAFTEVSVVNNFSTGIVDIELDEYTIEDGKEKKWENNIKDVLPGDDIYKIPRISNHGNDCYVRAYVHFVDTPLDVTCLKGMSDNWILAEDGYFYYKEILETGKSVDLFQGIKIPVDLTESAAESLFTIKVDVDAIQSNNFDPDYDSSNPWGEVQILGCEKEGMYDINTFKKPDNKKFSITYEGDSNKLIKNEDDFFMNFPVLLPGDTYTDTLLFTNDSNRKVNLYFRTASPEGTDLLNKVTLKITKQIGDNKEVIYDGDLRATKLYENMLLAVIDKGKSGSLTYEIHVPEELQNPYSIMEDYVMWVFATDPIAEIDTVKTGDDTLKFCTTMMIIGLVLAVIGLGMGVVNKRRDSNA